MASIFDDLSSDVPRGPAPTPEVVDWLHRQATTDGPEDVHHRLGHGRTDAARGDHDHDGRNSQPLWPAGDIPANGSNPEVNAILALLRRKSA